MLYDMRKNLTRWNLTPSMIAWGVIMIIELVIMIIAANNLLEDPFSKGDMAFIGSGLCVCLSGYISLRREWGKKKF